MGYWNGVWSDLTLRVGSTTSQLIGVSDWHYRQNNESDTSLKYVSQSAYKSVLVHTAKQIAMQALSAELNGLLPKYQRYVSNQMRKEVLEQQTKNRATLIEHGKASTAEFGFIMANLRGTNNVTADRDGNKTYRAKQQIVIAKTKYGTPVPEALILSYELGDDESPVEIEDVYWKSADSYVMKKKSAITNLWNPGTEIQHVAADKQKISYKTSTVFHIDLAPQVSMSSAKNVVMTTVQGRDFTRKELISGGDMVYSVNGSIVSDEEGVYPAEAVKRFIKIMQYNGIVNVNYITFGLLGVKRIIIKDFTLGAPTYKNIQPYSFSCVAVEPDDAIVLNADTIASIDNDIRASQWDTWYKSILDNKLVQVAAKTAMNISGSNLTSLAGEGLGALIPNIV